MIKIENLFYSPVKSISFTDSVSLNVLKDKGIENDRIFAFVQNMDTDNIKNLLENPQSRKLNNFITLKNTPELNKYNFTYMTNKLVLKKQDEIIISINPFFDIHYQFVSRIIYISHHKIVLVEKSLRLFKPFV